MPKNKKPTETIIVERSTKELDELDEPDWFEAIGELIVGLGLQVDFDMDHHDRLWGMSTAELIPTLQAMHDEKKKKAKQLRRLGRDI